MYYYFNSLSTILLVDLIFYIPELHFQCYGNVNKVGAFINKPDFLEPEC